MALTYSGIKEANMKLLRKLMNKDWFVVLLVLLFVAGIMVILSLAD